MEEDIEFLIQLASSLKTAEQKLSQTYLQKSSEEFNKIKKIILKIQEKILEVANE